MSYRVKLEIFEGPLDLLLYLVKQNHLEITEIPIAQITDQYLRYLEMMQALDLEIAGEFLVIAATLIQIKSRKLLPPEVVAPEEEPDPEQELIQRLLEYQRFKQAAQMLGSLEKERLMQFGRPARLDGEPQEVEQFVEASLFDLLTAFSEFVQDGLSREMVHEIIKDEFTVGEKIILLRELIQRREKVGFSELFAKAVSKMEIVATFLALLELIRLKEVAIRQPRPFGKIVILRSDSEMDPLKSVVDDPE